MENPASVEAVDNSALVTIRKYIVETLLFGNPDAGLSDSDSLSGKGIVDSAGVLSLIVFLEETFGIHVLDEEVVPENLDSIEQLAEFVRCKKSVPG
jgi:acyl carrier protein